MSFYDEFLKSLEEDNEELDTAVEGLEDPADTASEENPVEDEVTEPETSDDEVDTVDEVDDDLTDAEASMEAYQEFMEPIVDLFVDDVANVVNQYIAGEIAEEAFVSAIDDIIKSNANEEFSYDAVAVEGIIRDMRARKAFEKSGIDRKTAENIYYRFASKFTTYKSQVPMVDKYLNSAAELSSTAKYDSSELKKAVSTAAEKTAHFVKQRVAGIYVAGKPVNRSGFQKLFNELSAIIADKEGTIEKIESGKLTERELNTKFGNFQLVIDRVRQLNQNAEKAAQKKTEKNAAIMAKQEARKEARQDKGAKNYQKRLNRENRLERYRNVGRAFKEVFTGAASDHKYAKNPHMSRYAKESFCEIWDEIEALESLQTLWEVNPEAAYAMEAVFSEICASMEEVAIESAIEEDDEMLDLAALESAMTKSNDPAELEAAIEKLTGEIDKWENRVEILKDQYREKSIDADTYMVKASEAKKHIRWATEQRQAYSDRLKAIKAKAPVTESATEGEEDGTPAEEAMIEVTDDEMLSAGMESILFLEALRAGCSSEEEYKNIISENATELQLYGVVDPVAIARESYEDEDDETMEAATEAKNIVRLNREAKISTEVARMSIGLAKKANDPLYKYYHKYSVLKRQFRDKIYAKYNARAVPLARKAVMNGRNRAAMINSPAGNGIVARIDSRLKQLDKSARNMTAIKKDLAPSKPSMGKAPKK